MHIDMQHIYTSEDLQVYCIDILWKISSALIDKSEKQHTQTSRYPFPYSPSSWFFSIINSYFTPITK